MEWIFSGDRPIWMQLSEQLKQRIVTGAYPRGEKLPPVRDLAAEAGVNPNTMQRALHQLETEGLTVANRTTGRTVTDCAEILDAVRKEMAEEKIKTYFSSMHVLGYSEAEAKDLLIQREGK